MNTATPHFEDQTWIDFIRGVADPEIAAALREHLESGCGVCREELALWQSVSASLERERSYELPPAVVRSAKAAFVWKRRLQTLGDFVESARLVFDSYLRPVPAGVRGGFAPARHLVHETGEYMIDLQIEPTSGNSASLAGQIVKNNNGTEDLKGTPVILAHGQNTVLQLAIAGDGGEFEINFEFRDELILYLDTPGPQLISIRLPDAASYPTQTVSG